VKQKNKIVQKAIRVEELLCDECNLRKMASIVGHGFTDYTCNNCNKVISYSNTGVPKMCKPCAIDTMKCQRCMNDLKVIFI
jgi:hypothetical protein